MRLRSLVLSLALSALTAAEPALDAPAAQQVMGDWAAGDGWVAQVVALGQGRFRAHVFSDFSGKIAPLAVLDGINDQGRVSFVPAKTDSVEPTPEGVKATWWPAPATSAGWSGSWCEGNLAFIAPGQPPRRLSRIERPSPTLGLDAPAGAVVLLGKVAPLDVTAWVTLKDGKPCPWKALPEGALEVVPDSGDIASKQAFGAGTLHLEFRTAFLPEARGAHRSNSGVFLQDRYEIQILDSHALQGGPFETGSLYTKVAPSSNPCRPPLQWQTYDIDFTPAVLDGPTMTAPARFTVRLNGVTVQDGGTLSACTGRRAKIPVTNAPGPIVLQDHQYPVAFRNCWFLPR